MYQGNTIIIQQVFNLIKKFFIKFSSPTLYNIDEMQIIDSPGVRDIDIDHLNLKEIILGFPEILNHSLNCVFPNCSHQIDEGCAVHAALKNGDIKESRYNNFIFLSNQEKSR